MNIVFFGSSKFAVPALKKIYASGHKIACVVTQPDKRKGRGLQIFCTPVKQAAQELKVNVYQPLSLDNPTVIEFLSNLKGDLFVVISYGKILSKAVLSIPKILAINLHASLLPKYRGAAPINWAIINGEKQTGVTIIEMNENMDAGRIILQRSFDIEENDTAVTLEEKLAKEGADLLLECLDKIENNDCKPVSQDESHVTFAPKLKKDDGLINWSKQAYDISNLVRGCHPWPGSFTYYKNKLLKIWEVTVSQSTSQLSSWHPGEVVNASKKGILVATTKDILVIKRLQIEGKRPIEAKEFIAGYKIKTGEIFGLQ